MSFSLFDKFDMSGRFCYFLDLEESNSPIPGVNAIKRGLAKTARTQLFVPIATQLSIDKNNNNEVISEAIKFLA